MTEYFERNFKRTDMKAQVTAATKSEAPPRGLTVKLSGSKTTKSTPIVARRTEAMRPAVSFSCSRK